MINGHCHKQFIKIYEIFSDQLASGHELGCSVAIEYEGNEVANLFGGYANTSKSKIWKENTLVNVWSVTKAVTGITTPGVVPVAGARAHGRGYGRGVVGPHLGSGLRIPDAALPPFLKIKPL